MDERRHHNQNPPAKWLDEAVFNDHFQKLIGGPTFVCEKKGDKDAWETWRRFVQSSVDHKTITPEQRDYLLKMEPVYKL